MKTHNILVTGTGAIIGYGIINALRRSTLSVRIVAIDIYDTAYGQHVADTFRQGVLAESAGFIDFINTLVEDEAIDLIIPGIEQDLYALHQHRDRVKCQVVMNNDLCIELSKNKWATYEYLRKHSNLPLIPTLYRSSFAECTAKLGIPFLLKPLHAYACKGIQMIESKEDFDYFTKKANHQCIFQKIIGTRDQEYTVSVFGDGKGAYFDGICLRRYLSREGATSYAEVVENPLITDYVNQLVTLLKPIGPTNIQARIENDTVYLLEINPRCASACSIRAAFGYNEPEMCIRYFLLGEQIRPNAKRKGKAIRYIDDHIVHGQ